MRSKFLVSFAVLLFIAVAYFFLRPDPDGTYRASIATMGLNFVSKGMCSCLWVSEHPRDFCIDYARVEQVSPSIEVDIGTQTVTASLFGIFHASTKFEGPKRGCRIL